MKGHPLEFRGNYSGSVNMKRGKKYTEALAQVDRDRAYGPSEAVDLLKNISFAKFDETVEASIRVNFKSLQNVRGTLTLPHSTGKVVRILVVAGAAKQQEAKDAGADFVGDKDYIEKIQGGWTDFDVMIATPDMMKDVGKLGPILGRKGLMPKPKAGTVTNDLAGAIKEIKAGRVEYKADKTGVIHARIGKKSSEPKQLAENLRAFYQTIVKEKPAEAKGNFIQSLHISSTMSPGIKIDFKGIDG